MAPYRVEYLCSYRPVWRWDGAEFTVFRQALHELSLVLASGRKARLLDARDLVLWGG